MLWRQSLERKYYITQDPGSLYHYIDPSHLHTILFHMTCQSNNKNFHKHHQSQAMLHKAPSGVLLANLLPLSTIFVPHKKNKI